MNIENAEVVGRPIIEKIIAAHDQSDYALLKAQLPELSKLPLEAFDEAVKTLRPLGTSTNILYLGHLRKIDVHVLLWKVSYSDTEEEILWTIALAESDDGPIVKALLFDR